MELEWSFEKIDGVGVELELKFLIRYGVGVAYPRSCPSLLGSKGYGILSICNVSYVS
jgi:hypothetical protein